MANKFFLGIDTSCYTTSMAVIDETGSLIHHDKIMLNVKKGQRGLRQSDGFYQHMFNLEQLLASLRLKVDIGNIVEIVVSEKPRDLPDSYMPVFNSGLLFSKYLSHSLNIPIRLSNHQQNHILSTMFAENLPLDDEYISFHLSGGTTDILSSKWHDDQLEIVHLGGSLDVSFGQLIDRLGVLLNYDFPCGKAMDEATSMLDISESFSVKHQGLSFNLSGYENKFKEDLTLKDDNIVIVKTFNTIIKVIDTLITKHFSHKKVLLTGGVSANSRIKKYASTNKSIYIAESLYSMDHAIGNSYLGFINKR